MWGGERSGVSWMRNYGSGGGEGHLAVGHYEDVADPGRVGVHGAQAEPQLVVLAVAVGRRDLRDVLCLSGGQAAQGGGGGPGGEGERRCGAVSRGPCCERRPARSPQE